MRLSKTARSEIAKIFASMGGHARAAKMTQAERSESARNAGKQRWKNHDGKKQNRKK